MEMQCVVNWDLGRAPRAPDFGSWILANASQRLPKEATLGIVAWDERIECQVNIVLSYISNIFFPLQPNMSPL